MSRSDSFAIKNSFMPSGILLLIRHLKNDMYRGVSQASSHHRSR